MQNHPLKFVVGTYSHSVYKLNMTMKKKTMYQRKGVIFLLNIRFISPEYISEEDPPTQKHISTFIWIMKDLWLIFLYIYISYVPILRKVEPILFLSILFTVWHFFSHSQPSHLTLISINIFDSTNKWKISNRSIRKMTWSWWKR